MGNEPSKSLKDQEEERYYKEFYQLYIEANAALREDAKKTADVSPTTPETKDGVVSLASVKSLTLNLRQLKTIVRLKEINSRINICSPLLLFSCDSDYKGKLDLDGFIKVVKKLQEFQNEMKKEPNEKTSSDAVYPVDLARVNADPGTEISKVTKTSGEMTSDDIAVPKQDAEDAFIQFTRKKLIQETSCILQNKKKFVDWLFRLADVDSKNKLDEENLCLLLYALQSDGINPEDLSFDEKPISIEEVTDENEKSIEPSTNDQTITNVNPITTEEQNSPIPVRNDEDGKDDASTMSGNENEEEESDEEDSKNEDEDENEEDSDSEKDERSRRKAKHRKHRHHPKLSRKCRKELRRLLDYLSDEEKKRGRRKRRKKEKERKKRREKPHDAVEIQDEDDNGENSSRAEESVDENDDKSHMDAPSDEEGYDGYDFDSEEEFGKERSRKRKEYRDKRAQEKVAEASATTSAQTDFPYSGKGVLCDSPLMESDFKGDSVLDEKGARCVKQPFTSKTKNSSVNLRTSLIMSTPFKTQNSGESSSVPLCNEAEKDADLTQSFACLEPRSKNEPSGTNPTVATARETALEFTRESGTQHPMSSSKTTSAQQDGQDQAQSHCTRLSLLTSNDKDAKTVSGSLSGTEEMVSELLPSALRRSSKTDISRKSKASSTSNSEKSNQQAAQTDKLERRGVPSDTNQPQQQQEEHKEDSGDLKCLQEQHQNPANNECTGCGKTLLKASKGEQSLSTTTPSSMASEKDQSHAVDNTEHSDDFNRTRQEEMGVNPVTASNTTEKSNDDREKADDKCEATEITKQQNVAEGKTSSGSQKGMIKKDNDNDDINDSNDEKEDEDEEEKEREEEEDDDDDDEGGERNEDDDNEEKDDDKKKEKERNDDSDDSYNKEKRRKSHHGSKHHKHHHHHHDRKKTRKRSSRKRSHSESSNSSDSQTENESIEDEQANGSDECLQKDQSRGGSRNRSLSKEKDVPGNDAEEKNENNSLSSVAESIDDKAHTKEEKDGSVNSSEKGETQRDEPHPSNPIESSPPDKEGDKSQSHEEKDGKEEEKKEEKTLEEVAKKIMDEYSKCTGGISLVDFILFGDLIIKKYDSLYSETTDRIGKYELRRKIGEGATSSVKAAVDTETGKRKAIKIVKKSRFNGDRLDKEIKAMKVLSHPNIVQLEELLESKTNVYFVMELYTGGNLAEHVEIDCIPLELARHFFSQMVSCVAYCHSRGVIHRDLKLENILLDHTGKSIYICDFGQAGLFSSNFDFFSTGLVGSLYHLSPEQINGLNYSGSKIDVWALGVCLYRMLTGCPPFYSETPQEIVDLIDKIQWSPTAVHPATGKVTTIPDEVRTLLEAIFVREPEKRPSAEELKSFPFLRKAQGQSERDLPSIFNSRLELAGWINTIVAWQILSACLREFGIHHVQSRNNPYCVRCHYVQKDIKFLVTLVTRRESLPASTSTGIPRMSIDSTVGGRSWASVQPLQQADEHRVVEVPDTPSGAGATGLKHSTESLKSPSSAVLPQQDASDEGVSHPLPPSVVHKGNSGSLLGTPTGRALQPHDRQAGRDDDASLTSSGSQKSDRVAALSQCPDAVQELAPENLLSGGTAGQDNRAQNSANGSLMRSASAASFTKKSAVLLPRYDETVSLSARASPVFASTISGASQQLSVFADEKAQSSTPVIVPRKADQPPRSPTRTSMEYSNPVSAANSAIAAIPLSASSVAQTFSAVAQPVERFSSDLAPVHAAPTTDQQIHQALPLLTHTPESSSQSDLDHSASGSASMEFKSTLSQPLGAGLPDTVAPTASAIVPSAENDVLPSAVSTTICPAELSQSSSSISSPISDVQPPNEQEPVLRKPAIPTPSVEAQQSNEPEIILGQPAVPKLLIETQQQQQQQQEKEKEKENGIILGQPTIPKPLIGTQTVKTPEITLGQPTIPKPFIGTQQQEQQEEQQQENEIILGQPTIPKPLIGTQQREQQEQQEKENEITLGQPTIPKPLAGTQQQEEQHEKEGKEKEIILGQPTIPKPLIGTQQEEGKEVILGQPTVPKPLIGTQQEEQQKENKIILGQPTIPKPLVGTQLQEQQEEKEEKETEIILGQPTIPKPLIGTQQQEQQKENKIILGQPTIPKPLIGTQQQEQQKENKIILGQPTIPKPLVGTQQHEKEKEIILGQPTMPKPLIGVHAVNCAESFAASRSSLELASPTIDASRQALTHSSANENQASTLPSRRPSTETTTTSVSLPAGCPQSTISSALSDESLEKLSQQHTSAHATASPDSGETVHEAGGARLPHSHAAVEPHPALCKNPSPLKAESQLGGGSTDSSCVSGIAGVAVDEPHLGCTASASVVSAEQGISAPQHPVSLSSPDPTSLAEPDTHIEPTVSCDAASKGGIESGADNSALEKKPSCEPRTLEVQPGVAPDAMAHQTVEPRVSTEASGSVAPSPAVLRAPLSDPGSGRTALDASHPISSLPQSGVSLPPISSPQQGSSPRPSEPLASRNAPSMPSVSIAESPLKESSSAASSVCVKPCTDDPVQTASSLGTPAPGGVASEAPVPVAQQRPADSVQKLKSPDVDLDHRKVATPTVSEQKQQPIQSRTSMQLTPQSYFEFSLQDGSGLEMRRTIALIASQFNVEAGKEQERQKKEEEGTKTKFASAAAVVVKHFENLFKEPKNKTAILITGKVGVGKTTLAKQVFSNLKVREEVQGLWTVYDAPESGMILYDSKGFEVDNVDSFVEEVKKRVETKSIGMVWFVVDGSTSRFEPFEQKFCQDILKDIPYIIIVNKADTCKTEDLNNLIDAIKSNERITAFAVLPATASSNCCIGPSKCTNCHSDDICFVSKSKTAHCNTCGNEMSLSNFNGLEQIIEESTSKCSESTRRGIVANQQVSVRRKVEESKNEIKLYFTEEKGGDSDTIRLLSRLCNLWELDNTGGDNALSKTLFKSLVNISRGQQNKGESGEEGHQDPWTEELKSIFINRFVNYFSTTTDAKSTEEKKKINFTAFAIAFVVALYKLYMVFIDKGTKSVNPETMKEWIGIAFANFTTSSLSDYSYHIVAELEKNGNDKDRTIDTVLDDSICYFG